MTGSGVVLCRWVRCAAPGPYADDRALFEHLHAAHNPPPRAQFICQWEGCAYASRHPVRWRQQRAIHLICHTNYRPHACSYPGCDRAFRHRVDATKHAELHDWALVAAFPCQWAGCTVAAFPGPSELGAHIEDAHMGLPAKARGQDCGWAGCTHAGGNLHTVSHFPAGYRPYKCDVCGRTFKAALGLARHAKCEHSAAPDSADVVGDDRASAVAPDLAETEGLLFPSAKRARDSEDDHEDANTKRFKDLEGDSESELDIVITVNLEQGTRALAPEAPAQLSGSQQVIKEEDDDWVFYT